MCTATDRPNILFVMTDQQRFDALSCHGGWIQTPNLDRLAKEGADLQQHYSQAPVCVPSRCSIFTGRYPHDHGILENDRRLDIEEDNLFKSLKSVGYRVSYSGKNHFLEEGDLESLVDCSDELRVNRGDPQMEAYEVLERNASDRLGRIGSYASAQFHDFPDRVTNTGRTVDTALRYLANSPVDSPWCVVASFSDPHVPHLAPRRYEGMYPLAELVLPDFDPIELESKHPRVAIKRELQGAVKASEQEKRFYLSVYGSMCSFVDEQIGRILDELQRRPDADRTIVVFLSDHGDFGWNRGMCKKDLLLYDELLHVPAIVRFPPTFGGITVKDTFTEHIDILPTLLDLAGIEIPSSCQGKSMKPLLRQKVENHKEQVFAEVCYPDMRSGFSSAEDYLNAWALARNSGGPLGRSASYNLPGDFTKCVRTDEWKYIWYGDGFEELYQLDNDASEMVNRAKEPQCSAILSEMRVRMSDWLAASNHV